MQPTEQRIRQYAKFVSDEVFGFAKAEYGFDESLQMILEIKMVPRLDGGRSCGGRTQHGARSDELKPYMSLNFNRVMCGNWSLRNEYDHVATDEEIGHRHCLSWEEYVLTTICHEVAHVIEFSAPIYGVTINPEFTRWGHLNKNPDDHGAKWQTIYRFLRNHFVNYADELLNFPEAEEEEYGEVIGRVRINHGFAGSLFMKGEFDLVQEFKPTPEAILNHEKFGLPLNVGFLRVLTSDGVKKIEVKQRDYQLI